MAEVHKQVMRFDYVDSLTQKDRTKNYVLAENATDANIKTIGTLIKNVMSSTATVYRVNTTNIDDLT